MEQKQLTDRDGLDRAYRDNEDISTIDNALYIENHIQRAINVYTHIRLHHDDYDYVDPFFCHS